MPSFVLLSLLKLLHKLQRARGSCGNCGLEPSGAALGSPHPGHGFPSRVHPCCWQPDPGKSRSLSPAQAVGSDSAFLVGTDCAQAGTAPVPGEERAHGAALCSAHSNLCSRSWDASGFIHQTLAYLPQTLSLQRASVLGA